jgi:ABC-type antimicrobial peptide transport system permease subunit
MKKTNISKFIAVGLCICALTGCGASPDEKPDTSNPIVNSNTNEENANGSSENKGNDILESANLIGSVLEFTDNGCSVSQAKEIEGGAGIKSEAAGLENKDNAVSVTYNPDCEFVVATLNKQSGVTNVTTGSISDVKKQSEVYLYGEFADTNHFNATKVVVSEAEIVGIYQVDQKMSPLMQGDTYRSENVIFTDLRFPEKAESETSPLYERAYFKVKDVEAYDEVKQNLQNTDINWEQYDLIDNNGNSETMSSNFNDLAKVSEMMILVISVASFVILVLVFLFWLKNRVQEVGIFLSLGVPKFRIIGQIWSEAIMIAVLSLMLSFAVAPAVSKVTANYLVSQQVQQMQEEEKNNEGKVSTEYVAPKQDVQSISVEVTPEMYLLDGVSVLVLITASVLVSGIVILKRNPKDILSEMS